MGNTQHTGASVETTMLSSGFIPGDIVFLTKQCSTADKFEAASDEGKVEYYVVQSVQTMAQMSDIEQSGNESSRNSNSSNSGGNSGSGESDQIQVFPNQQQQQQQRLLFTVVVEPLAFFFHRRKGAQARRYTHSSEAAAAAAAVGEEWRHEEEEDTISIPRLQNLRSDHLSIIEDDQHTRRRIEYRILQIYISECERLTTEEYSVMNQRLIHALSECMLEGEPLREIDLSQENLSDLHLEPLCTVLRDPDCMVVKINLSNNVLGPKAAVNISHILQHSRTVSEIDLSGNNLTYEGAVTLSHQIKKSRTLTVLSLANTGIGPKGCDLIIDALICNPHHCIMKLDLRYNGCTEPQISSLLELAEQQRQLCFIDIYPHHCNDTGDELDNPTSSSPRQSESPSSATEAWLTLQGWTLYGKLRTALSDNMEYIQQNPNTCVHHNKGSAWIRDVEDVKDYILYNLSIAKQNILDPLIHEHHRQSQEAGVVGATQKPGNKKENVKNFFEWRLQKQRLLEYRQLQQISSSPSTSSSSSSEQMRLMEFRNELHTKRLSQRCSTVSTPVSSSVDNIESTDATESSTAAAGTKHSTAESNDWLMVESNSLPRILPATAITEQRDPLILCKICMEEKPASAIYILDHCYHKFCLSCIETYICVKIQNFEVDSIRCPDCSERISHHETEMLLKVQGHQHMVKLFQKFSLKKALLSMPGMIWCPNPQCSNAMLIDVADDDNAIHGTSSLSEENGGGVHQIRHEDREQLSTTAPKFDASHGIYFQDPIPDNRGTPSSTTPALLTPSSSHGSQSASLYPPLTHSQQHEFEDQYLSSYIQSEQFRRHNYSEVPPPIRYPPLQPPPSLLSHSGHMYPRVPTLHLDSDSMLSSYAYNPAYDDDDHHLHSTRYPQRHGQQPREEHSHPQGQSMAMQLREESIQSQQPDRPSLSIQQSVQQKQKQKQPSAFYHLAPVVTCQECQWVICTECKLVSHAGQTCSDARTEREQTADETFNDWLRDHNAKQCPYCGITIDKKSGCNDMHCKNCNGHFCWVCLEKLGKHDSSGSGVGGVSVSIQRSVRQHFTNGSCYKYSLSSLFSL